MNECKSSIPSPNEKNRDSSDQSFSYKNSMTKIVNNNTQKSIITKKEESQCSIQDQSKNETPVDSKIKTRN